jgi:hypothetical protein
VSAEGVATEEAVESEPGGAEWIMESIGIDGVLAAGGAEAALAAEERREGDLVEADEEDAGLGNGTSQMANGKFQGRVTASGGRSGRQGVRCGFGCIVNV